MMLGKLAMLLVVSIPVAAAQTAPVSGYCTLGGSAAKVSGLSSTNYLQGIIPFCTVTVYLTGTQTLATIYKDGNNTPLGNPFTANNIASTNPGGWQFYAAQNAGLDVVLSGGIAPNTYPSPVTALVDIVGGPFCPLSGCTFTGPINGTSATFSGTVAAGTIGAVIQAAKQAGTTADARLNSALSVCGSGACVIDMRGEASPVTFASTVTITRTAGTTIYLPCGLVQSPGGSIPAPMFRTWSGTSPSEIAGSNISFIGCGQGATVLQVPAGAICTQTNRCNIFEPHDPADTSKTNPIATYISWSGFTMDGNKANVAQPASGASNDLSHNGIMSNGIDYYEVHDVFAENFWYGGLTFGLYSSHGHIDGTCVNNGYSSTVGYGCLLVQGQSDSNFAHVISYGDVIGAWILNNVHYNVVDVTAYNPASQGLVFGDVSGNSSYGNIIRATVTGAGIQGCSAGASGGSKTINNDITCNSTGAVQQGAVVGGAGSSGNHFHLTVSKSGTAGVQIQGGTNSYDINASDNSQASHLSNYGIEIESGATQDRINATLIDDQATATQRTILLNSGTSYESINAVSNHTAAVGSPSDSGTGNQITLSDTTGITVPPVNNGVSNGQFSIDGVAGSTSAFLFLNPLSGSDGYIENNTVGSTTHIFTSNTTTHDTQAIDVSSSGQTFFHKGIEVGVASPINAIGFGSATCGTTAATAGSTATCAVIWNAPFASTPSTVECTLSGVTNVPTVVGYSGASTTGVTVTIAAVSAAAATGTAFCTAFE